MLFLDCGNTLIKWVFRRKNNAKLVGSSAQWADIVEEIAALSVEKPMELVFASVRSVRENEELLEAIQQDYPSILLHEIKVSESALGVKNGYLQAEQLGLDRWLGVIAAYHLSGKKACVVIDAGTAITVDLIDATGQHLGGYICPGFTLMRDQLKVKTRRIRYEHDAATISAALEQPETPGVSTVECVERGCFLMIATFLREQLERCGRLLGADYCVYVTGGDGALFSQSLPEARLIPELVFIGLELIAETKKHA